MVLHPPYHFSAFSPPRTHGITYPPTRFDVDEKTGIFSLQATAYAAGRIAMRGNLGVLHQLDQSGIYEVTVNFLANGRLDIFALGVPLLPPTQGSIVSGLPLSLSTAEVTLIATVEDANIGGGASTTFLLVNESHTGVVPQQKVYQSLSPSLSIYRYFPTATSIYIYVEIEVVLRAAGIAFSSIDFGSGGTNFISVPFILIRLIQ